MTKFVITHNDNGFHIQGKSYWFEGNFIELPLYATRPTYQECIEWLNENFHNDYEIVKEQTNEID